MLTPADVSIWYFAAAHKHYAGPKSNIDDNSVTKIEKDSQN